VFQLKLRKKIEAAAKTGDFSQLNMEKHAQILYSRYCYSARQEIQAKAAKNVLSNFSRTIPNECPIDIVKN